VQAPVHLTHNEWMSRIEWTEQTWNPTTGCTKVSPGCLNCYAEIMARRLHAMGVRGYERNFELATHASRLEQPLQRKQATLYFVNSMSDLFHQDVPDEFLDKVFDVIGRTPRHTYQILTKRAARLPRYFKGRKCPDNVWLGVSVEDRRRLRRLDSLRQVKARVRFLSLEPLLEDLGEFDLSGIHWVIVGGESGHRARPMHADWANNLRRLCASEGVPFFFKQWGKYGADGVGRSKGKNGRRLAGRLWNQYPATN
jgi:protein gp37